MGLEKAIASGKERRAEFRKAKAVDRTCRCHGGCRWCEGNRKHAVELAKQSADDALEDAMERS